jgi:hypothetical protein
MDAEHSTRPDGVAPRVGSVGLMLSFALPASLGLAAVLIQLGVLPEAPWSPDEPAGSLLYWMSFTAPAGLLLSAAALLGKPRKIAGLGFALGLVGSVYWSIFVFR